MSEKLSEPADDDDTDVDDEVGDLPPTRDEQIGPAMGKNEGVSAVLRRWRNEIRVRADAQQLAAVEDARYNLVLGVLVTILAAIGASGIIAASSDPLVKSLAGLATLLAAVIAGVQTVARFGESSGAHRGAAASFGRVKTRLDLLLARGRVPTAKEIEDLIVVMERLDTETPVVSNRLWKKAKKQIKDRVV